MKSKSYNFVGGFSLQFLVCTCLYRPISYYERALKAACGRLRNEDEENTEKLLTKPEYLVASSNMVSATYN